jgi:toxin ParE1/3/4
LSGANQRSQTWIGSSAYIGTRNYGAAKRLQEQIETCAERLPNHPFIHRVGRDPGTREAVVHPNYILIYEVDLD